MAVTSGRSAQAKVAEKRSSELEIVELEEAEFTKSSSSGNRCAPKVTALPNSS